ncbi:pyridine nucleotide-disulfide oxidoreductase [Prauserella marina]|uniref:3-phenylpropionate/trans-cinnamate dioxygenase ferredoxin reductase subunit n=1 Tax=Prauserella marina TaxID=530584 RepID=A0A222VVD9_9PSEU|nr:FAD-dependent oxidoreductase [Prauserella marina]ASR37916.1 pyridine nucleotide-disulfide oxidoreductase [Prauserella marina]PWV73123.1 3-phenylpropionate/trans-cinnamate dioxygenase ferredoxin reductase subunit [Prauserella marina]SDD71287.1 3-phenylpropionate/trans-cinnamate dioxygenase ferredoxin reductase subunit [Prauserella marina]
MRTVAIVGTSLAGLRAAQQLRAKGYSGRLVMIGEEIHRPYDRPPLSKDFLLGRTSPAELALGDAEDLLAIAARWRLGTRAERLDVAAGEVVLGDGSRVAADGVVIATGATPRALPGARRLRGVHTLRSIDDAVALRDELRCDAEVVVVGAGFVGAEVASSAKALGCSVTVVEAAPVPLAATLGTRMAAVCARLHADNGVRLLAGTGVASLESTGDQVTGVRLTDGGLLRADVVVVGIGAVPATGWLAGSGIAGDDGVTCDAGGVTGIPSVVAVGDVANISSTRSEHWSAASEQPGVAVGNLLAGATVEHHRKPPYFWSDQYEKRIQFVGTAQGHDEVRLVEGDPEDRKFVASFHKEGTMIGALGMSSPKPFTALRKRLDRAAAIVQLG